MRIGVYPGSFDPITLGHWDIIARSLKLVDKLIIAVAHNDEKKSLFSVDDRMAMIRHDLLTHHPAVASSITVATFDGLLVDFVTAQQAHIIIRGIRVFTDFDFEFQLAGVNAKLNKTIETVFLNASESNQFISSRYVKEIARLGGDVGQFVSPYVQERLHQCFID